MQSDPFLAIALGAAGVSRAIRFNADPYQRALAKSIRRIVKLTDRAQTKYDVDAIERAKAKRARKQAMHARNR